MNRIAIVVQRCHPRVVGGSEMLAWQYAMLLKGCYDVHILTVAASDAATWRNDLPEGSQRSEGVTIHRFHVDGGREPYWHALHERLLRKFERPDRAGSRPDQRQPLRWTLALQEEFIRRQGPYAEGLFAHLEAEGHRYRAVIFFTYLFPTTYFGVLRSPRANKLLVPTLHDEPPAHLSAFKYMVQGVRKLLWNTEAERRLGCRLWGPLDGRVVGMEITTTEHAPMTLGRPYILYSGRIDLHKGCDRLLEFFARYKRENPSDLNLILTGKDEMGVSPSPDVEPRGFVPEDEKFRLMAGARAFVIPSPYESLSIVTLEAMAQRTPVLVNGACEVLADHVQHSGGGMTFHDYDSFACGLNFMLNSGVENPRRMGERARCYVLERYSHDRVRDILIEELEGGPATPN